MGLYEGARMTTEAQEIAREGFLLGDELAYAEYLRMSVCPGTRRGYDAYTRYWDGYWAELTKVKGYDDNPRLKNMTWETKRGAWLGFAWYLIHTLKVSQLTLRGALCATKHNLSAHLDDLSFADATTGQLQALLKVTRRRRARLG